MIIYDNRDVRFILCRRAGSVLLSHMVLIPAFLSTCLCGGMCYWSVDEPQVILSSSVARLYATVLGFVVVFRTSIAFSRYFEGVSHVQKMFSKWRDAFMSIVIFIERSIAYQAKKGNRNVVKELLVSKARMLHWFTLLGALAVRDLQMSYDVRQSIAAEEHTTFADRALNSEESISAIGIVQEPVYVSKRRKRAMVVKRDVTAAGDLSSGIPERKSGLGALLSANGNMHMGIVGFDALLDADSGVAMAADRLETAVFAIGSITPDEMDKLFASQDRVLTVMKWVLLEVSAQIIHKNLLIAPPILSRVYQEVGNGMLAFFMAQIKISVVPFPFPFAQVLGTCLYAFYVVCPFIVLEIMQKVGLLPRTC
eukprot:TRINITY_DN6271_c0_g1_i2.p1 TRINITY_DN6271_c0_g1~~TRINITY_DN6271_c0_g1_i2.p1  ORF type:complete len:367 (-),score=60.09 TRINITY_DN6271_c0_g1_i2:324-1424(-)